MFWVAIRIPSLIENWRIYRAERKLLRELPLIQARTAEMQIPVRHQRLQRDYEYVHAGPIRPALLPSSPPRVLLPPPPYVEATPGPATELPSTLECKVCLENQFPEGFPTRQPTDHCPHPVECCKICLSRSITSAFEGNMWDDIRCPICNIQLQHKDVAEFASPDIFERLVSWVMFK